MPRAKLPVLREGDRIELLWLDSGTVQLGETLEDAILHECDEIGYYVDTTPQTIRICMEKTRYEDGTFHPDTIAAFWLTAVREIHKLRR